MYQMGHYFRELLNDTLFGVARIMVLMRRNKFYIDFNEKTLLYSIISKDIYEVIVFFNKQGE